MFLVLMKTDADGTRRHVPSFSRVTPLTAEQLEMAVTTDLQRAQLFRATPQSLSGETVLRLEPAPPPGLEDWTVHMVGLRLPQRGDDHARP